MTSFPSSPHAGRAVRRFSSEAGAFGPEAGGGSAGGTGVLVPPRTRPRDDLHELPIGVGWPPAPPDGEDGFGGGGGGGDGEGRSRGGDDSHAIAMFALRLALAGVTTLFVVFLGVWLLLRRADPDAGPGDVDPSAVIWLSTVSLLASSATLQRSLGETRLRRDPRRRWLAASLLLGLVFLAAQTWTWFELTAAGSVPATNAYGAMFYVLTGLHAAHVLVGLGYLAWLLPRSRPLRLDALRLGATYWHFMAGIWVVLFVVLYFVR